MKNRWKILVVCALAGFGLLGCGKAPSPAAPPPRRVVTQVDVTRNGPDRPLRRHYTQPGKMEEVLNYVRLLQSRIPSDRNPDAVPGALYQITLTLSDGGTVSYRQKGGLMLQKEAGPWQKIDPDLAMGFDELLEKTPSDQT